MSAKTSAAAVTLFFMFLCSGLWLDKYSLFTFAQKSTQRHVLVFGGNGFMGGSTVERLIEKGDNVTIVNRGNWYWDSNSRIRPYVQVIHCDRKEKIEHCPKLKKLIEESEFDVVIDFSGYAAAEVEEAARVLQNKVGLYVYISTDSVYDVSDKKHQGPSKETDAVRPESEEDRGRVIWYHNYGHNKLEAEEALFKQRQEGGFPFVILRLPDVIGPRDSTYRWWLYQLWLKLSAEKPPVIPHFLVDYEISFVYSEDVARVIVDVLSMGPQIKDQAINLAYPETQTLDRLLHDIQRELGLPEEPFGVTDPSDTNPLYYYPSVRKGPVDVTKALNLLNWKPTPWDEAVRETIDFYEKAMTEEKFSQQRDEIVQIFGGQLFSENQHLLYESLEKIYHIELNHFKQSKDEL